MLRDEILVTLAYYDVLDMPLTAEEIFRYLIKKSDAAVVSLADVRRELDTLSLGERESYYYLFDRQYLVPLRLKRTKLAWHKWRLARRTAQWLTMVPFVRAIFASGSLSMNNTDELSDLDIIVVAQHGRIWLTRLLMSGMLGFLRMRRTQDDRVAPDKICPNHFITDESLKIPFQSIYTAQLYANLVPLVVDDVDLLKKFQIQNEWLFHYIHHWQMPQDRIIPEGLTFAVQFVGEFLLGGRLGNWLEDRARRYQKDRIQHRPLAIHPGGHLTYSDKELAFHSQSSEGEILLAYENSQSKLASGLL